MPIYNNEKYVKTCIDSVRNQSYSDWKLLLIDDGSTDNSGKIIDEIAEIDYRLEVYHLPNNGVSYARNYGLSKVQTPYVMFLDSDDELSLNALNVFFDNMRDDFDILIGSYIREYVGTCKADSSILNEKKLSLLTGNIIRDYWSLESMLSVPVAKIYKTKIINENNLQFPIDMVTAEDQYFNNQYLKHVKKYKYIAEDVYKYKIRSNEQSLSKNVGENFFWSEIKILKNKIAFFEKYNTLKKEELINRYINAVLVRFSPFKSDEIKYDIFQKYINELSKYIQNEKLYPVEKYKIVCMLIRFRLCKLLYLYYKGKCLMKNEVE